MSITLDIPDGLASELSVEAKRFGLSVDDYVLRLLTTERVAEPLPKTGSQLVAYWREHGIVGSRPDIEDSRSHSRELRRQAEQRLRD